MKTSLKILFLLLISVLSCPKKLWAEQNGAADSLQISLLTCSPGDAPYELYGHTAIRVQDFKNGSDLVFNYGVFDFSAPHFEWRFMLGETDYTIGTSYFTSFANSYYRHGRSVVAQVLNLTSEEKTRLYDSLLSDWKTPGWTYRYSFIYDNCTTRAIQHIVNAVSGKVVWPDNENGKRTFRDILHEFAQESPWANFGDDLVLGAEVDQPIDVQQQLFAPLYAERFLDVALVRDTGGVQRRLVLSKDVVVEAIPHEAESFPISPMGAFLLLLSIVFLISIWEYQRQKTFVTIDYILMVGQGVAGCIVAFLFFLSAHPAVDSNWLIVLLNPIPLCYLPVKLWRDRRGARDYYFEYQLITLCVFFVSALFNVQEYPSEIYLVALILLLRVMVNFSIKIKRKKTK